MSYQTKKEPIVFPLIYKGWVCRGIENSGLHSSHYPHPYYETRWEPLGGAQRASFSINSSSMIEIVKVSQRVIDAFEFEE